jgi:hypothetical protein
MKNIHLIPTEKPSRFFNTNEGKYHFREHYVPDTIQTCKNHNIYITSEEEIKEGDYVYTKWLDIVFKVSYFPLSAPDSKKIILTTDKELIKDGVQDIDDDFLEWFVKNPSCENVDISKHYDKVDIDGKVYYKIIIPQEEPTIEEEYLKDQLKKYEGINVIVLNKPEEPKQEKACKCVGGVITCPGCNGDKESEFGKCAGCEGVGLVRCGKCGGKETKQEETSEKEQLPTKWFKTEQIETWIGESITTEGKEIEEINGGRGKLIVIHQCGGNKKELISQLETMINGLKDDFDSFGS